MSRPFAYNAVDVFSLTFLLQKLCKLQYKVQISQLNLKDTDMYLTTRNIDDGVFCEKDNKYFEENDTRHGHKWEISCILQ